MKLLQLNTWTGKLEKPIKSLLKEVNPDIVCLQEALSISGGDVGGWFYKVEAIQQDLRGMNLAFSPVLGFPFMRRKVKFGNAILSNMPFESTKTLFTRFEYTDDFDFETNNHNARNLLHVTIQNGNSTLHVLTHHGYHIANHKKGDSETLRQCRMIADYVKTLKGQVILTGDFNLEPHSESLELINQVLTNLSIEANLKTTRNTLTHKTEVCDYIFVNDQVKVNSFSASDEIVSDHQALILDFN